MSVTIKDLRYRTRQVLQGLKRGLTPVITYRGHKVARIIPLSTSDKRVFRQIGFGMWRDRSDMDDVNKWLSQQRKPRYGR